MPPITLLTDFGIRDTYVAQMKGVIASIAPEAGVIDLTHAVPPRNVTAAAVLLDVSVDAFPENTLHVAVVDPGVGSTRRAIAAQTEHYTFVGPDNGLFTAVWRRHRPQRTVTLTQSAYHRRRISATFHGRDVFAPVAAHLFAGTPIDALGPAIDDPVTLALPTPHRTATGYELCVLYVDHFGNLVTNMTAEQLSEAVTDTQAAITVGAATIVGIHSTFADVAEGEPVAYLGSSGRLEIALRNDDAAARWRISAGDTVHLHL